MRCTILTASLILLAVAGCTKEVKALSEVQVQNEMKVQSEVKIQSEMKVQSPPSTTYTATLPKSTDEKPCLSNLAGGLAECTSDSTKQKRFVLVRSVAIPEN